MSIKMRADSKISQEMLSEVSQSLEIDMLGEYCRPVMSLEILIVNNIYYSVCLKSTEHNR